MEQPGNTLELLKLARDRYTQKEIAGLLGVTERTVRRWELRTTRPPAYLPDAIRRRILPMVAEDTPGDGPLFTFADLFAGIGGIRLGFEAHGGQCVFTSEWNQFARKTYLENFPQNPNHTFAGDITKTGEEKIPDHDVLLAGFPCQPFSIAGVSKKNALGCPHGFQCTTQGTLFFDVARIIAAKKPRAFLLENVKNLVSHDKGRTFRVILQTLRDELGYDVHCKVIDGRHFVPQHRERILIAGFCKKTGFSWDDLQLPEKKQSLSSILHPQDGTEPAEEPYTTGEKAVVAGKYTLTPRLWAYLRAYAEKHRKAGNGFGYGLVDGDSVTRTLSARYYKDGSEILLSRGKRKRPRRLTPRECARLMGFPDTFRIPVSDTQAYKQFGNSVVVPVIREAARITVPHVVRLCEQKAGKKQLYLSLA
ncbi:MAG: DNA (cytosine-5-)-methyltransferase [Gammaproteobacteria bacterium]|nr:DNA (cytosine-5-)-methyltransferase [Gammaproteobacteria bacterium]